MAKSASQVGSKWGQNSSGAGSSYVAGVNGTTKDQAALAIAAKPNLVAGFNAAMANGSFEKGLQRSGTAGWKTGVQQKGQSNYETGVSAPGSIAKYVANSGKFDAARNAASSITRGPKGAPGNLARVTAVVSALRAAKLGK